MKRFLISALLILGCILLGKMCGYIEGNLTAKNQLLADGLATLEQKNEVYALLMQNNPLFKKQLQQALQTVLANPSFIKKWQAKQQLDITDIENLKELDTLLVNEFGKYVPYATEDDIYDMYQTEYKHLIKNNCKVFPLSPKGRNETIAVKSKLIKNSVAHPQEIQAVQDDETERIFTQIIKYYTDKGYNIDNLSVLLGFKRGKLMPAQACQTTQHFYEALLALPKKDLANLLKSGQIHH